MTLPPCIDSHSLYLSGMSHVREARMLCRKTVDLFTLLSHTQETGARRIGMTQELLALVTGLAHYLKILIRIALTGALKLEREQQQAASGSSNGASSIVPMGGETGPMANFLDKLRALALQNGNPAARRLLRGTNGDLLPVPVGGNSGTQGVTYGFRSLAPENAGESPFSPTGTPAAAANGATPNNRPSASNPPSDLCVKCGQTVEEDCVRLGTYQRWHSQCVQCEFCGKVSSVPGKEREKDREKEKAREENGENGELVKGPKLSTGRRPPANVAFFVYDVQSMEERPSFGEVPRTVYCKDHANEHCRAGFQTVSRLEQYAFLLNVALRRLYLLLKKQGVVPLSPGMYSFHPSPFSL